MSTERDPLVVAIAREIHKTWCPLPGHSYGDHDYTDALEIVADVRAHIEETA